MAKTAVRENGAIFIMDAIVSRAVAAAMHCGGGVPIWHLAFAALLGYTVAHTDTGTA
ncbi:hypothetical protein [Porphyrobacter sp. AAP60]|uniref:hypothetical protein n=1 Tax=Porphyrobacter sp. AAP60 TaxID=1523423 RepID=UPI0018D015BB|nr:hypothetical protein [Porphyrobacter sp. AAP60]